MKEQQHISFGAMVRSGLAAVPCVGGSLAQIWSEWHTTRRFARVDAAIQRLSGALAAQGTAWDLERIGDEELQLLEEILRRVQIEHSDRKRKRFEQLLVCSWIETPRLEFSERMRQVRAVERFDELHIAILSLLSDAQEEDQVLSYVAIADTLDIPEEQRNELLLPALNCLASEFAYLRRAWGMSSGESGRLRTGNLSPEGIARKCEHELTDAGRRFLNSLSTPSYVDA